ncbi:CapA family protein [uncultured Alsobacter sp.]|uniref:CapA family protein n=1 Tax=uncultured Alsobacter sp. TaxID=1748258 RepID=UPI0025E03ED7|nr:CapA family protein [uncultured Alsobacter sp.]
MSLTIATGGQLLVHGPLDGGDAAAPLRRALADAVAFSNFEACVETEGAWPTKAKTLHLAAPGAMGSLRALGFSAVTHANNHAFDLGPPGLARTRDTALAAGLAFAGSGATLDAAWAPALVGIAGRQVAVIAFDLGPQPDIVYAAPSRAGIARVATQRVVAVPPDLFATLAGFEDALGDRRRTAARAAVGYGAAGPTEGFDLFGTRIRSGDALGDGREADPTDMARAAQAIAAARAAGAALVAVSLHSHHWDSDWTVTPAWLTGLGRRLIDAGADMIVGHGAPVLQGVSFHAGKPILSGLGNLVFHTRRGDTYRREGVDVFRGAVVRACFAGDGTFEKLSVLPVAVPEEAREGPSPPPVPLGGDDADAIMERLAGGLSAGERALVERIQA